MAEVVLTIGDRSYTRKTVLGEGGFSQVFLGADRTTGKRVALKILSKPEDPMEAKKQYANAVKEIKAMKAIGKHQNIVAILGYDLQAVVNGKDVIVMIQQLCPKGELFDYLMYTKHFSPEIAMAMFAQLCAGLNHMHTKGIAHRDLKPENLLLSQDFTLKIADFGFSFQFQKGEKPRKQMLTELGTKGYMAPEITDPKAPYDEKADVFACGVILFIMLAGFPPFQEATKSDWWFNKIMARKHDLFWKAHERAVKFEKGAKTLILKMLEPVPKLRPTIAKVMENKYFEEYATTYKKDQVQDALKKRKKQVDEKKLEERRMSNRDLAIDFMKVFAKNDVSPLHNQCLSLSMFLTNPFMTELSKATTCEEIMHAMVNAVDADNGGGAAEYQYIASIKSEIKEVMSKLTNIEAIELKKTMEERLDITKKSLKDIFSEEVVEALKRAIQHTTFGDIDDWEKVVKFANYESNMILPQFSHCGFNAWKTKIGYGVLVYAIDKFCAGKSVKLKLNKQNASISLKLKTHKQVVLPVEKEGDLKWIQGKIPIQVALSFRLFKGDGDFNVLTIQNDGDTFSMERGRLIIEELTTRSRYYLRYFLSPFSHSDAVLKSWYYTDEEIDEIQVPSNQ